MRDRLVYYNENGQLHKTDGPAVIFIKGLDKGLKEWFINGQRHREDGPAIVWYDREEWFYLNDKRFISKEEWEKEVTKLKLTRILYL
jgi:hypothetical protein